MPSSNLHIDPRRRAFVRLIGEIRHALNQALAEEHAVRGLTRAEIGRVIGRDRSFVTRKLTGISNMTLETLADLAFALGRPVKVHLASKAYGHETNQAGKNPPQPSTSVRKPGDPILIAA